MIKLKTTTRNKALDAITTDAGATAYLWVYTGSPPGKTMGAFNSATGTLLSKHSMANPIGGAASNGVFTASAIADATATGTGAPGYFRINTNSSATDGTTTIVEGTAGVGSGDLNFAASVTTGATVSITSLTITEGNA